MKCDEKDVGFGSDHILFLYSIKLKKYPVVVEIWNYATKL